MTNNQVKIDLRVREMLGQQYDLARWMDCFGSPLNLVYPQIALENGRRWLERLRAIYPNTDIHYSMKACKSSALAVAFSHAGLGMDVSSAQELMTAVNAYASMKDISFTGPEKPDHELALCISHGISVNLDSKSELKRFIALQIAMNKQGVPILRMKPPMQPESRFGFTAPEIIDAANLLSSNGNHIDGLSFHLSEYSTSARIDTTTAALKLMGQLSDQQIPIGKLSIGGGFLLSYLERASEKSILNSEHCWQNKKIEDTYPYYSTFAAEEHAARILDGVLSNSRNRQILNDLDIKILLEPGRALTDQCGGTCFSVLGGKETHTDMDVVVLKGMGFSLSETWFGSDFLPQPQLVKLSQGALLSGRNPYVLAGRSCLERDVIRWQATKFDTPPAAGDLIYIPNTAGYQMDSNESTFHQIPLPRKLAVFWGNANQSCILDNEVDIRSLINK